MRWVGDEVEEMKWVEMRWTEMRWAFPKRGIYKEKQSYIITIQLQNAKWTNFEKFGCHEAMFNLWNQISQLSPCE
jgi:hypothetical protein